MPDIPQLRVSPKFKKLSEISNIKSKEYQIESMKKDGSSSRFLIKMKNSKGLSQPQQKSRSRDKEYGSAKKSKRTPVVEQTDL